MIRLELGTETGTEGERRSGTEADTGVSGAGVDEDTGARTDVGGDEQGCVGAAGTRTAQASWTEPWGGPLSNDAQRRPEPRPQGDRTRDERGSDSSEPRRALPRH